MLAARLLASVVTLLLFACGSSQSAVRDVTLDRECGIRELSGSIRGLVVDENREPTPDVRVRFVMSDDASVVTATDEDGRFEIRCVYPAKQYQICLGPESAERCQNVDGPSSSTTLQSHHGG
jgi:hypothetical protein